MIQKNAGVLANRHCFTKTLVTLYDKEAETTPSKGFIELHWLDIMRVEGGRNAEEWLSMDLMGLMQQLEA